MKGLASERARFRAGRKPRWIVRTTDAHGVPTELAFPVPPGMVIDWSRVRPMIEALAKYQYAGAPHDGR